MAATKSSTSPARESASSVPPLVMVSSPWITWSYNPYNASALGALGGFVYLPLAIQEWPSISKFIPVLATSWSVQGNKFVINLRHNVTWQNGHPFTSTDVVDSLLLDGTDGAAIWNDINNVSATGTYQVALTMRSGVPLVTLEADLFSASNPVPASVYGRFVTPSLKQDVIAYYNEQLTNPSAAPGSSAGKAVAAVFTKLEAFSPKTAVGDGPYEVTSTTLAASAFRKWSGFYDASKITIPSIIFEGTSQSQDNADLLSGKADFSNGWLFMPPVILQQWLRTPNAHLLAVPGTFQGVIIFNDKQYPWTITKVRQAMAYAIPVKQMDVLSWGSVDAHAVPPAEPDGLVSRIQANYLTPAQIASLPKYSYDPSKAASLLESVGFKKVNGTWRMPNGKPFDITMSIDSSWSDQVAAFKVAVTGLSSQGFPATENEIENTTYISDMHTGAFQVAAWCCTGGAPNPLEDYAASAMGGLENYSQSGTYKGDNGISYGPVETVPGIGRVNIPAVLSAEAASTSPGPKMDSLVWDWARFVETQVPFLEYAAFANQIAYSSKYFAWPSTSNPLWVESSNAMYDIVLAQESGQLHPK